MSDDPTLTVDETATRLDVHPQTVYRALRQGTFPVRHMRVGRVWRISAADLDEFLARRAAELQGDLP